MNRPQFLRSKFTVEHLSCFHVRPQSAPARNILVDIFWRTNAHIFHWLHTLLLFSRSVMSDSLWHVDCSTPGLPVLHYPLEFAQTRVHWVSDAIQLSHPLSPPSPPNPQTFPASGSFPMSWLFASGGQSTGTSASASVLPMNIQGWFPLALIDLISLLSEGFSRVFSSTTVWKYQFFGAQPSLWALTLALNSYNPWSPYMMLARL